MRIMDEEVEKEEADRAWEERRAKAKEEEEEKVRKNREKREKAKARKAKKGKGGGPEIDGEEGASANGDAVVKKRLGPAKIAAAPVGGEEEVAQGARGDATPSAEEMGITIHEDD